MSISTIQEKLFNKGCGSAVIVIVTVAMGISFISGQCGTAQRMNGGQGENGKGTVVVTVGNVPVLGELIQAQVANASEADVATRATGLAQATRSVLQRAAVQDILSKGPAVTEAEASRAATRAVESTLDQVRGQLQGTGKIKPGASDADFEKAVKDQLGGKSLAQVRTDLIKRYVDAYKDPTKKSGALDALGVFILAGRDGEKLFPNDQALRDSFKTLSVRRVFLSAQSGSTEKPELRAAKALADLKAGTAFDKLMDTVSNDPAPPGKKAHELVDEVAADSFARRAELAELKDKPINATTGVVDVPGGKAIYQLVGTKANVPPDFDKNKDKLRDGKAQAEVERQVNELLASSSVKWESPGYHALALAAEASSNGFSLDPAKAKAAFDAGKAAFDSKEPAEKNLGALAMIAATSSPIPQIPSSASPADQLAALEAAQTAGLEDPALSMRLATLYGDKKDGTKATAALIAASKGNSRYDVSGQKTFGDIAGQALKLQSAKVITADQLKAIQAQQSIWSASRSENEKATTEAKRQEAEQEKANAAILKQQQEEAAKNKPATNPPAGATTGVPGTSTQTPPTTTSGSLLPTTTGSGK